MGLFSWWRKPDHNQQELERVKRKCHLTVSAYKKCIGANKDRPRACEQLDNAVVICYGNELVKDAMQELNHCINRHIGKHDCDKELEVVREALRRLKVYPVKD